MKAFLDEYLLYMNGLEMSQIEKEETCRRSLTTFIRRPLRDALKVKTGQNNIGLNTFMQFNIKAPCLHYSSYLFSYQLI